MDWWIRNREASSAWYFQRLTAHTAELKAEADRSLGTISDDPYKLDKLGQLIQRVKSLDAEIATSLEQLPDSFKGKTVAWQGRARQCPGGSHAQFQAFPGAVDVYPDLWVANLWNVMRSMRLVLAGIVVRCVAMLVWPRDYRTTEQYSEDVKLRTELISGIVSSVPYHYGLIQTPAGLSSRPETPSLERGQDSSTKALAGYMLLYSLARIMSEDCIGEALRKWIREQLTYIGDTLGIRYAKALTQVCHCMVPRPAGNCTL